MTKIKRILDNIKMEDKFCMKDIHTCPNIKNHKSYRPNYTGDIKNTYRDELGKVILVDEWIDFSEKSIKVKINNSYHYIPKSIIFHTCQCQQESNGWLITVATWHELPKNNDFVDNRYYIIDKGQTC